MEILALKIRGDLHKHNQTQRARWLARWRWLQLLTLACGLLIAIYSLLPQRWPFHEIVPFLLFAPMLILTGLQPFIYAYRKPFLITGILALVYIILAITAGVLNPFPPEVKYILPDWANWFSLIILLVSWGILLRLILNSPTQARQYSLRSAPILSNLLIGVACGVGLALHLYLVAYFIVDVTFPPVLFAPKGIIWAFSILIGIVVPAEELIFRGAAFSILYDELNTRFSDTVLRITSLDVLIYLVILASNQSVLPLALLMLLYRAGLSAGTLYLVLHRRSLLPAMVANLIFSLATGWLLFI